MKTLVVPTLFVMAASARTQMGPPPGGQGGPPPSMPGHASKQPVRTGATESEAIHLLSMIAVQNDLALTEEPWTALNVIAKAMKGVATSEDAALAAVSKVLTATQIARLEELVVQDLGYNSLVLSDIRAKLSLTTEQAAAVLGVVTTLEAAEKALGETSDPASAVKARTTLLAQSSASLAKLLSAEQDSKLRSMAGRALGSP